MAVSKCGLVDSQQRGLDVSVGALHAARAKGALVGRAGGVYRAISLAKFAVSRCPVSDNTPRWSGWLIRLALCVPSITTGRNVR